VDLPQDYVEIIFFFYMGVKLGLSLVTKGRTMSIFSVRKQNAMENIREPEKVTEKWINVLKYDSRGMKTSPVSLLLVWLDQAGWEDGKHQRCEK
jgi:hypothetical protein